jgi:2-alkyl-3-oxoalkanoate reductase
MQEESMNIFVAGASGAIGRPLITALVGQGHAVTGITRTEEGARKLRELGASVAQISVYDARAVEAAIRQCRAEIVIDEPAPAAARPVVNRRGG